MVILGMRGGPGSWIGQDYRGVYWRYWVGSGEPPAETTETKEGGEGKKERREQEKKKSENEPKEEGWGEKNEHHKYSQGQHITITTAATVSSSLWCSVDWFHSISYPLSTWKYNWEQASRKYSCKWLWLFSLLPSEQVLIGNMELLPNKLPISEVNWTAATRIYTLLWCFIK